MIKTDIRDGVGYLTLARAEKKNAFNGDMLQSIDAFIHAAAQNPSVRVIVLGAEGETFCAGADLAWMAQFADASRDDNIANARALGAVFHHIAQSPKPVIGRIQGAARGGGVGLAAAVDIAIASEHASFALTEVRLGLLPGVISPFVVERVGPSRARALFMTGAPVDAQEAWRIGMVHHVVAAADLDNKVAEIAGQLIQGGPDALLACKQLVDTVAFRPHAEVFGQTAELIADRRVSPEAQEGMMAFLTKRKANWIP